MKTLGVSRDTTYYPACVGRAVGVRGEDTPSLSRYYLLPESLYNFSVTTQRVFEPTARRRCSVGVSPFSHLRELCFPVFPIHSVLLMFRVCVCVCVCVCVLRPYWFLCREISVLFMTQVCEWVWLGKGCCIHPRLQAQTVGEWSAARVVPI